MSTDSALRYLRGASSDENNDAFAPPAQARIVDRLFWRETMFVAADSPRVRKLVTPFVEIGIALAFVMLAVPASLRVITIA